jgi:glutamyl-tRNA reductase
MGQVREALEFSSTRQYSGKVLEPLFQKALSVGKRIRTETKISQGKVSIASAAMDLAHQHNPLTNKKVLLVGTGNMGSLVAEYLNRFGKNELVVIGRTPEKLEDFCQVYSGRSENFAALQTELKDADILFSATSCPRVLITKEMVGNAVAGREKPLTLVDIAMPADIDPAVKDIQGVQHFSINDLHDISSQNMAARQDEARKAEVIIENELGRFKGKLQNLHVETFLSSLNTYVEDIRRRECEKALTMLENSEPDAKIVVESMSKSLTKKIMHNFLMEARSTPDTRVDMEKFVDTFMGNGNVPRDSDEETEE